MSESIVTRNGQVTLTKEIRAKLGIVEGDTINLNLIGDSLIISKKDPNSWDKIGSFLPANFNKIVRELRSNTSARLNRLGIYE